MTRLSAFFAVALALSACDASGPAASDVTAADLDDAAVVVANALALDAGGVLEDAAAGASLAASADAVGRHPGPDRRGCTNDRAFDPAAGLWTVAVDCERGRPGGPFSSTFARTSTYRFLGADGAPQRERAGAASVEYDVLSGSSLTRTPRRVHALTGLTSSLTVTALDGDLVSVSGSAQRAATDTLRGRRGERTLTYALDATLTDVRGPRSTARRWRNAVAGTVSGRLQATLTRTPTDGETTTVEIDEAFEVTFPTDGSGDRVAAFALGGRPYRADLDSGEVASGTD